ncbi:MAG: hypothetical protein IJD13_08995 [Oscillospiraceae bacterium]|nr:hypothetical protein [Oscillospiraceae bacterium]
MEKKQETFTYTYSAGQQEEVQNIRKKYLPPEEDKMDQLRKLHRSATRKAEVWALVLGIAGALIMGSGMSLVMTDIGGTIGLSEPMIPGIMTGIIGMISMALAYPVYNRVLKKERQRIAPEILRLSDELLK